jgi:hypothetical protein
VNRLQNRARARLRTPIPGTRGCETAPDSTSCYQCCDKNEAKKGKAALHTCYGKCIRLPPPKPEQEGVFGRLSKWASRRMHTRARARGRS